ncbi:DNA polymerase III subunit delta', partial [Psychrobacter sp. 16-Bac2893]
MSELTNMTDDMYFAPLLPWQHGLWSQLTMRVLAPQQSLPHALLAAGMQGMGKRAFVWRLVAWLLCRARDAHPLGACGHCESCQWLRSGTHPSLQVLPLVSLPVNADS